MPTIYSRVTRPHAAAASMSSSRRSIMPEITTTDLADFGWRELKMAAELLSSMIHKGLPEDFESESVRIMFNWQSGYVFLTNAEFQVAMMNGGQLETWYTDLENGIEGFREDLPELSLQRLGLTEGVSCEA